MNRRSQHGVVLAVAGLLSAVVGCGPIASTSPLLQARDAVEAVRAAGGAEDAVYELTSAEAYLNKAREQWSYSDFKGAKAYADLAIEQARRAMDRMRQNRPRRDEDGELNGRPR
jgi:hypothetical protein